MIRGRRKESVVNDETRASKDTDAFVQRLVKSRACERLSWSTQLELLRKYRSAGDKRALNKLVLSFQRMIIKKARQYLGKGLELADLVQAGNVGLMRAIHKYDESRNTQLSTVVDLWLRDAIQTALKEANPMYRSGMTARIQREFRVIREREGRDATPKEVSDVTGIPEEKVRGTQNLLSEILSLDDVSSLRENESRMDSLPDYHSVSVETQVERRFDIEYLEKLLSNLSPDDLDFIRRKYGLSDGWDRTRSEAAELYEMDEQETARWEKDIIEFLRSLKDDDLLNESRGKKIRGDNSKPSEFSDVQGAGGTRPGQTENPSPYRGYSFAASSMDREG